jgi:hypothetical protein
VANPTLQNTMKKYREPLRTINIIALCIAFSILGGIFVSIFWVFASNEGMLFGIMLAFTWPILLVFVLAGSILYFVLVFTTLGLPSIENVEEDLIISA